MKDKLEIHLPHGDAKTLGVWNLFALPYVVTLKGGAQGTTEPSTQSSHEAGVEHAAILNTQMGNDLSRASNRQQLASEPRPSMRRSATCVLDDANSVIIRIEMPSNYGIRSWRSYEACIETVAVGIYLYATFVLTSIIFLSADQAISYATVMTICSSGLKFLYMLF